MRKNMSVTKVGEGYFSEFYFILEIHFIDKPLKFFNNLIVISQVLTLTVDLSYKVVYHKCDSNNLLVNKYIIETNIEERELYWDRYINNTEDDKRNSLLYKKGKTELLLFIEKKQIRNNSQILKFRI